MCTTQTYLYTHTHTSRYTFGRNPEYCWRRILEYCWGSCPPSLHKSSPANAPPHISLSKMPQLSQMLHASQGKPNSLTATCSLCPCAGSMLFSASQPRISPVLCCAVRSPRTLVQARLLPVLPVKPGLLLPLAPPTGQWVPPQLSLNQLAPNLGLHKQLGQTCKQC